MTLLYDDHFNLSSLPLQVNKLVRSKFSSSPTLITMKRFISPCVLRTSNAKVIRLPLTSLLLGSSRSQTNHFSTTKMSFSNTDTGDKPADPYKTKNFDDTTIKEKIEDLSDFMSACKFGMMTTRDGSSGALVSRCMALAAQVCIFCSPLIPHAHESLGERRH